MSGADGHLFIVHGLIDAVVHDAAVIPAGHRFTFNPVWHRHQTGPHPREPDRWKDEGWGRVSGATDRVWAVSVGGRTPDVYKVILDRVKRCLASIGSTRDAHESVRGADTLPLVAVPVFGIGRTGYGDDRGTIVRQLIARLESAAHEHSVDIALVTPDPAVYAAAQYARRRGGDSTLSPDLETSAKTLGGQARKGELALFLGAGVGMAAGLPSWDALVDELATTFDVRGAGKSETGLSVTDRAALIERVAKKDFPHEVVRIVGRQKRPSLLHALLSGLDCKEVVTTNYDLLYEQAVKAAGRDIASVMPWSSAHDAERWVLKLHGDIGEDHEEAIVLTRRHMVNFDAANRPSAAVLQSLLLTKRLLVVGASMTDDNVIRLALEVQAFRDKYQEEGRGTFGTVLDVPGDPLRKQLWDGQFDWHVMSTPGTSDGTRTVELFLDRVAHHASRDSSWLLDERFAGLLDNKEDQRIAQEVRALYASIPAKKDSKWEPLRERLREMGVDAGSA